LLLGAALGDEIGHIDRANRFRKRLRLLPCSVSRVVHVFTCQGPVHSLRLHVVRRLFSAPICSFNLSLHIAALYIRILYAAGLVCIAIVTSRAFYFSLYVKYEPRSNRFGNVHLRNKEQRMFASYDQHGFVSHLHSAQTYSATNNNPLDP
jgi:hypothetical protein